ncbi:CPBP family intramembrane metalloprotease [Chryseobacterium sp. SSA4.19]|uniref:CPBP family intramembrane glutamic endopeptidase n=1 Tax=Chryseobacterium sp. SSA4.19 TaxID=2919915 RepID=UPI001F4E644A|nr:CPBP family intramembrane glutamic endopeptidase [Chryseobacterium sp. SSA4.19]MCJ8155190.1 CPBP family intramembrane metalloprotease [Chryseobacterium sp. SSA4.19]
MKYILASLKSDFFNLLQFIKKPDDIQIQLSDKQKCLLIFNLLLVEIIFLILFVAPADYFVRKCISVKTSDAFKNLGLSEMIFLAVIAAPAIEELVFRYALRYNRLFSKYISRNNWNKIFPYMVYISCVIFGFIHLDNYIHDSWMFYVLSPLIILSQLSGGLLLSYIRVRLNIFYSIIYHALWNGLFGIVLPFVMLLFNNPYIDKSRNYDLKIDEQAFFNSDQPTSLKIDHINNTIYRIEARQLQLQDLADHIYGKDQLITDEALINISFTSKKGISEEEFRNILKKKYEIEQKNRVKTD